MATANYTGGCQCGQVRFSVSADLDRTITCNCSRCARMGFVLAFAPAEAFTLESGADATTEYRFNRAVIQHLFCSTCGVQSFARAKGPDGSDMVAINVRCVDDVDVAMLSPQAVDGRSA